MILYVTVKYWYLANQIIHFTKQINPLNADCWLESFRPLAQIPAFMKWSGLGPIYPLTSEQDSVTKVAQAGHWCWSPG